MNIALFLKIYTESSLKIGFYPDGRKAPLHMIIACTRVEFFELLMNHNHISRNGERLNLDGNELYYEVLYRDPNSSTLKDQNAYVQITFDIKKKFKNSNLKNHVEKNKVDTGYIRYIKSVSNNISESPKSQDINVLSNSLNIFDNDMNIKVTKSFFTSLFNTNKNEQNLFTNEDHKIPSRLTVTQESIERLFYSLFQLPYEKFLQVPLKSFDPSLINSYLLGDLLLQDSFCDNIISRFSYNIDESEFSNTIIEISRLISLTDSNLFEISVDLVIKAFVLSKSLKNAIKELSNVHHSKNIGFAFENQTFIDTATLFKDFLYRLTQLSFSKKQNMYAQIEKTHLIERLGIISKLDVTYKPLLETIMVLSYLQKYDEIISVLKFKDIYGFYACSIPSDISIDNVLNNHLTPENMLFDYVFRTAINHIPGEDVISLKRIDNFHWHEYIIQNNDLHWMYLPKDFQLASSNNLSKYERYCSNLLESLKTPDADNTDLSKMNLSSFTDGRINSAFTITQVESTKNITVNLNPIIRGNLQIAGVPRWAGVFYQFDPYANLTSHNYLKFDVRSSDNTIEFIHVELKNNASPRKEHKVLIKLTDSWTEHSINLKDVSNSIMSNLEEICFVVTPLSLTHESLIGNFELNNISLV